MDQLRDPSLRPPERIVDFSQEVIQYQPDTKVQLDPEGFIRNLKSARKGLSGGLNGNSNERLKSCLDDENVVADLHFFAEADIPNEIADALMMCKLTATRKTGTKIRGLNAGDPFRRLVTRTLTQ